MEDYQFKLDFEIRDYEWDRSGIFNQAGEPVLNQEGRPQTPAEMEEWLASSV
ncbi:MAG TPA: hypothetical protein VMW34_07805 [Anaerolineales bacterium]|nr:hypothetical protein [Anaerolineales bacterium]